MANGTYAPPTSVGPILHKVRFLAQDTGPTTFHLSDPEVEFLISEQQDDPYLAAAEVADMIAGMIGGSTSAGSRSIGDVSISGATTERSAEYSSLAKRLRAQSLRHAPATPISTAISQAVKDGREGDTDRVHPRFRVGMHDYESPPSPLSSTN